MGILLAVVLITAGAIHITTNAAGTWEGLLVWAVLIAAIAAIGDQIGAKPKVDVIVAPEGLALPGLVDMPFRWETIERMVTVPLRARGGRFSVLLCIHPMTTGTQRVSGSPLRAWINELSYGTPLVVDLQALEGQAEDVIEAIREFAPASLIERSTFTT
ncbi:MAG: hypothetical protein ACFCUN_03820 [Hyphomicrobiaceae bacterium]